MIKSNKTPKHLSGLDHQRFISKYIKDSHITFRNHIFPNKPSDTNFNLDSKTQVVLIAQLSPLILSSNSSNDPIIHFIFFENMLIFLYMLIISYSWWITCGVRSSRKKLLSRYSGGKIGKEHHSLSENNNKEIFALSHFFLHMFLVAAFIVIFQSIQRIFGIA